MDNFLSFAGLKFSCHFYWKSREAYQKEGIKSTTRQQGAEIRLTLFEGLSYMVRHRETI